MRVAMIREFGGPEVFELRDVPTPEPGPGEVLVRVMATSVNPVDYQIRRAGAWAGVKPPAVIGYDVSGVVEAVGSAVREFRAGDEVFYTPEIFGGAPGSYAEYHVAREAIVARKPENLTHLEAAVVPLAGGTAWDALIARGRLRVGERVFVHGGAGGVGHFAVQIAKAAGAYVFATAGPYNVDFVRSLGADRPIDYQAEDFVAVLDGEAAGGVDLVLDCVGGDAISQTLPVVRPHSRIVSLLSVRGDLTLAHANNVELHFVFLERGRDRLDALRTLIARRQLRPHIREVFPLEHVDDAHRAAEAGKVRGKIAIRVAAV
ncbi:MAG: zinc-binding dehydrogenase [Candidatus Rokubacteria bacterium]|nr:zinc-binding dehydrogenase [Candidatus Rokubacteria bacterium]